MRLHKTVKSYLFSQVWLWS